MGTGEPLDRFLARRTKLSWAEARHAIHRRRVAIDGRVGKQYHVALARGAVVTLDGIAIADAPDDAVVLCHKPAGWACSHLPAHAPLLYDLVPEPLRHPDLQAAGRLDRDTTGLIVLAIEGRLIQRLTTPRAGRWKRYRIAYRGTLASDAPDLVARGLSIPDDERPCLPARLTLGAQAEGAGEATLELSEGRNHQVKRMLLALGATVTRLHRDRIGGLALPHDLRPGGMRAASADELAVLFA